MTDTPDAAGLAPASQAQAAPAERDKGRISFREHPPSRGARVGGADHHREIVLVAQQLDVDHRLEQVA